MAKYIGRQFNKGVSREVTRGTQRVPQFWLNTTELTFDEKVELVKDETTFGVIESQTDASLVKTFAEGSVSGIINDDSFGLVLNATLGTCVTTASGTAYTHNFSVQQNAQHQSLCLTTSEPNASGASSRIFTLMAIDSLEMNFAVGEFPSYSFGFMSNVGSSTTSTVSHSAPDNFKPQDGLVRISTTYAGLASGTSYAVKNAKISISKNLEDDHNIGSVVVTDRLNKQFQVTGSLEMVYDNRTNITELIADVDRSLQFRFTNTDKIVGASTNPSLTVNLAKVKLSEVARSIGNDDIVTQVINFEGYYSLTDSRSVEAILINDVVNYV